MTRYRWDTRAHADDEPRRVLPNGTPYGPWHDAAMALQGPAARALGDASRDRWRAAGGHPLEPVTGDGDCWPEGLRADFIDVPVRISRTLPKMDDQDPIHEIEALHVQLIGSARRLIYAESQYFASRRVAEAIARRLEEPDGPEIVIVTRFPRRVAGADRDGHRSSQVDRRFARRDTHGRFRLYHPITAGGQPIYVHAKVTIIDDQIIRVVRQT